MESRYPRKKVIVAEFRKRVSPAGETLLDFRSLFLFAWISQCPITGATGERLAAVGWPGPASRWRPGSGCCSSGTPSFLSPCLRL